MLKPGEFSPPAGIIREALFEKEAHSVLRWLDRYNSALIPGDEVERLPGTTKGGRRLVRRSLGVRFIGGKEVDPSVEIGDCD